MTKISRLFICLIKISLLCRIFVILNNNEQKKILKILNIIAGFYIVDKYK